MPLGNKERHEDSKLGKQDAFHVACVLCEREESFGEVYPGAPVRFTGDSFTRVRVAQKGEVVHGIVDPFLTEIEDYSMFWVLIKPGYASAPTHSFNLAITDVPEGEWSCKDC